MARWTRASGGASARGTHRSYRGRSISVTRKAPIRLLFIDNIFRFYQRVPRFRRCWVACPPRSAYQPNLATEMGELQERITSTKKGSVTSVQAVYVPADDLTDPAPRNYVWRTLTRPPCCRGAIGAGNLSGVDPLASTSRILFAAHRWPGTLRRRPGREEDSAALQGPAGHHRDSRYRRTFRRG